MKKTKSIFLLAIAICLLFTSVTVYATGDLGEDDITSVSVTEQETVTTTNAPTSPSTTDAEEDEDEEDEDVEDVPNFQPSRWNLITTTKKAVSTTSRRDPVINNNNAGNNNNNGDNDNQNQDNNRQESQQQEETEETTLAEGEFYIYMERNNGQKRLRRILSGPSLITEPTPPERPGFVFDGWYADTKFTTKWNFFTDYAKKGTVIYAKWVADTGSVVYKVTVKDAKGGYLEVNPDVASKGEPVMITVYPDEGMRLVVGSVTVNGKATDVLNFIMPGKDVVIEASFEKIPEKADVEDNPSYVPFIIGAVVLVIAVIITIMIVNNRRNSFDDDEIDENGTIITDEDDDKSWVDESIIVEDGFKNGEKVIGNYIPEDDPLDEEAFEDLE